MKKTITRNRQLFSLKETSEILGISIDLLQDLCKTGQIKSLKVSATGNLPRTKISQHAITEFIRSGEQATEVAQDNN